MIPLTLARNIPKLISFGQPVSPRGHGCPLILARDFHDGSAPEPPFFPPKGLLRSGGKNPDPEAGSSHMKGSILMGKLSQDCLK